MTINWILMATLICGAMMEINLNAADPLKSDLPADSSYVTIKDGHPSLDGKRVRYWGAIGGLPNMKGSQKDNVAVLDRLQTLGFNMIRLWARPENKDYAVGDGSPNDLLDSFLSDMSKRGMKVWNASIYGGAALSTDVDIVNDPATAKEWQKAVGEWNGGKPVEIHHSLACMWDSRLEAIGLRNAKQLSDHVNKYTGLRWADDPVFGIWELSNEQWWFGRMIGGSWQKLPQFFRDQLLSRWQAFLLAKYNDDTGLAKAWGFLLPGESLKDRTVQLAPMRDPAAPIVLNDANPLALKSLQASKDKYTRDDFTRRRGADVIEFLLDIWISHKQRVHDQVKAFGKSTRLAPLVWDTGIGYEIQAQYMQQHADAIAHDTYITGFTGDRSSRRFPWLSGLEEPPRMCMGVPWVEHNRVEGKPYFVYETQIEQPAKYRAEYPLRIAALGAIQDWDVVCWHYFGTVPDSSLPEPYKNALDITWAGGHPQGYHYQFDEVQMSAMKAASEIFRNGLLSPAPSPTKFTFGRPALLEPASMDYGKSYGDTGLSMMPTTYHNGVRLLIDPKQAEYVKVEGPSIPMRIGEQGPFHPTSEITYDWQRGCLVLDAPGAVSFTGFLANQPAGRFSFKNGVVLDNVTIRNDEGMPYPVKEDEKYIEFTVVSADGLPLSTTRKAWISLVSSSFNSGFALNEDKLKDPPFWHLNAGATKDAGKLPVLYSRVGANILAPMLAGMQARLLDWHGRELGCFIIPANGVFNIPADQPVFGIELDRR